MTRVMLDIKRLNLKASGSASHVPSLRRKTKVRRRGVSLPAVPSPQTLAPKLLLSPRRLKISVVVPPLAKQMRSKKMRPSRLQDVIAPASLKLLKRSQLRSLLVIARNLPLKKSLLRRSPTVVNASARTLVKPLKPKRTGNAIPALVTTEARSMRSATTARLAV